MLESEIGAKNFLLWMELPLMDDTLFRRDTCNPSIGAQAAEMLSPQLSYHEKPRLAAPGKDPGKML